MNKTLNQRQIKTIQNFWKWFQDNEQALSFAITMGINEEEVMKNFDRNLNYISKRLTVVIMDGREDDNKLNLFFSALGDKKLFPKVAAIKEYVPLAKHFMIHSFIKPYSVENETFLNENTIKILKNAQIKLEDYNTANKKIILTLYLQKDNYENSENLKVEAETLLLFTLGEVTYKRHISDFKVAIVPENGTGLLALSELQEFINYLTKINYNRKLKVLFE